MYFETYNYEISESLRKKNSEEKGPVIYTIFMCRRSWFQLGTLGAGNHYAEIQVVDEIYNKFAAKKMGIECKGQVCVMIHCGSRGLGHQVATGKYHTSQVHRDKVLVRFKLPSVHGFVIWISDEVLFDDCFSTE